MEGPLEQVLNQKGIEELSSFLVPKKYKRVLVPETFFNVQVGCRRGSVKRAVITNEVERIIIEPLDGSTQTIIGEVK